MRLRTTLGLLLVLGAGCAREGLPPGGPEDTTPPRVISTLPDSGVVGVPLDSGLEIEFSEPMRRSSVIDWVLTSPPREFATRRWRGTRFQMTGGEGYQPATTYTVIVGTGCRDAREGNPMVAPSVFVFSTGETIDAGQVSGRLLPKGESAHGTVVWALDVERAAARPDTVLPDYIAQAGADSTYLFLGLRTGRRYTVMAHRDLNGDRELDRELEFLAAYPETLTLTPEAPVLAGIDIDFRDPRAPGSITGTVIDSSGVLLTLVEESVPGIEAAAAASDTTPVPPSPRMVPFTVEAWPMTRTGDVTTIDTTGVVTALTDTLDVYKLSNLAPGFWQVRAFFDVDQDQRYDVGEPASDIADSVRVEPIEETEGLDLLVRPAAGRGGP